MITARWVVVAAAFMLLSACVPQGLSFEIDDRVAFSQPQDRARVDFPLHVTWEVREPVAEAALFALFVDRTPIRPGRPIGDVAGADEVCGRDPGCPDLRYLAERGVYLVRDATALTLDRLPNFARDRTGLHEITIVLLDDEKHRVGEAAWRVQFRTAGEAAS